jgi:hypothetical protein
LTWTIMAAAEIAAWARIAAVVQSGRRFGLPCRPTSWASLTTSRAARSISSGTSMVRDHSSEKSRLARRASMYAT